MNNIDIDIWKAVLSNGQNLDIESREMIRYSTTHDEWRRLCNVKRTARHTVSKERSTERRYSEYRSKLSTGRSVGIGSITNGAWSAADKLNDARSWPRGQLGVS